MSISTTFVRRRLTFHKHFLLSEEYVLICTSFVSQRKINNPPLNVSLHKAPEGLANKTRVSPA